MSKIYQWVYPRRFSEASQNRIALLTYTTLVLTLAVSVVGSVAAVFASDGPTYDLLPNVIIVLLELAAFAVLQAGYVRTAAWLMVSVLWSGLVVVSVLIGGLNAATISLLLVTVMIAALTTGNMGNVLFTVATVIVITGMYVVETYMGGIPIYLGQTNENIWVSSIVAVAATSIFVNIAMQALIHATQSSELHRQQLQKTLDQLRDTSVSRAYIDSILQSMTDMLIVLDADLNIETTNLALRERLGYVDSDLHGCAFQTLLSEQDYPLQTQILSLFDETRDGLQTTAFYRRQDGQPVQVYITANRMSGAATGNRIVCVAQDMTDRMRAEQALAHERNLLRTLVDSLPDYIHAKDIAGRYVLSNRAHMAVVGVKSQDEIIGKTSEALFGADVAAAYARDDAYIRETGEPILGVERWGVNEHGDKVWIYTNKVPLQDADGEITGIVAIATDITQRKQDEERLRQSEARNRALLDAMPDMMFVLDRDGVYIEAKAKHEDDLSAPSPAFIGQQLTAILPDAASQEYMQAIRRCLASGATQALNYQLETVGGVNYFETRMARLNPDEVISVVRNITEKYEANEEIRRREQMYRTLVQNLPDTAVLLYDHDLRFLLAEGRPLVELGYHLADMEGRTLEEVVGNDIGRYETAYRQALMGETTYMDLHNEPHQRDYAVTLVPLRNREGAIFAGMVVILDVTADRQQQQELRQYADALESSNRELQQFAYVASHDLQEPLRKIQAFGDRLASRAGEHLDPTAADYLMRMTSAANRMQTLIQDLLAFSRVTTEAKPFQEVDLNRVVDGVLADLELRIEQSGAQVQRDRLPSIKAEELQMRQLFQNLIGNALKYSRPDTPPLVTIRVKTKVANERRYIQVEISDNGIGFDPKYTDRIFGLFQRLHSRQDYEGTGMGLAICRKIVERHQGWIEATGEEGQGATFTVGLPAQQLTDAAQHPPENERN
jgi:PAS domain S-box-containing protein